VVVDASGNVLLVASLPAMVLGLAIVYCRHDAERRGHEERPQRWGEALHRWRAHDELGAGVRGAIDAWRGRATERAPPLSPWAHSGSRNPYALLSPPATCATLPAATSAPLPQPAAAAPPRADLTPPTPRPPPSSSLIVPPPPAAATMVHPAARPPPLSSNTGLRTTASVEPSPPRTPSRHTQAQVSLPAAPLSSPLDLQLDPGQSRSRDSFSPSGGELQGRTRHAPRYTTLY